MNKHETLREADILFEREEFDEDYMDSLDRFAEQKWGQTNLKEEDYENLHDFAKHLLMEAWNYMQKRIERHGVKPAVIYLLDSYELCPDDEGYNDEIDKEKLYMTRRTL